MSSEASPRARAAARHAVALLAVSILAAAGLAACGKKGAPLPPLRNVPGAVSDLVVQQQGRQILLDFAYPSTTVGGQALDGIDSVVVWQYSRPPLDDGALPPVENPEFTAAAEPLVTLRGAELAAAVTGERLQVRLPLPEPPPAEPVARFFAVTTTKGEETADPSNRVGLVALPPPPPPSDLQVTATGAGVELTWAAPADTEAFEVFRRSASERGYGEPVASVPGDQRRYLDESARFGERYIYTVRSLTQAEPRIYSTEAGEREIELVDRFAPPLPEDFVALPEEGSVRLRWDASPADDVAGYLLYREDPGGALHPIVEDPVAGLEHIDRGLVGGLTYRYRIQVVDRLGNASEQSPPISATPR